MLTGETGAGKSILLDAFSLALGGRGDGGLVRSGEPQGQVIAVFDPPPDHPARLAAAEQELSVEGDLILRRVQMADGRSRAFVNDQPVSIQALQGHRPRTGRDSRPARRPRPGRSHRPSRLARRLSAVMATCWARRARPMPRSGEAEKALRDEERLAVEAARKEADFLGHAHEELAKLEPARRARRTSSRPSARR